jgi:predicted dehydrogenase
VIEAGIHVVVEKPLATSAADAKRLVDAAASAGVVATVPFAYRFHPLVRELRARRIAGEFGDLTLLHGSYLQDWLVSPDASSWRVDAAAGGASRAFGDIGSHWCDLVEFVSGERFTSVSAVTSIAYDTRPAASGPSFGGASTGARVTVTTEDTAIATFRTATGVVANAVISQVAAGRKNRLWFELDGSTGSAVFDQENPESVWLGGQDGSTVLNRGEGAVSADQARLNLAPSGHPMGYLDAFAAFVADTYAAIGGASPEGLPTFADGLRSATIIDAVLTSAATTQWTEIPS